MTGNGTYTSNLLYHSNELFKKKETKNYSYGDGGSWEDILICCDDGRSFRYSKILFTIFLQSYCGFSNPNISEDSDVVIVSFLDIGSLLYLINFFYTVHHDESCYICKHCFLATTKQTSNCETNEEVKNSRAAGASEDSDCLISSGSNSGLVVDSPMYLGEPLSSNNHNASRSLSDLNLMKDKQSVDVLKHLREDNQNLGNICEHCGLKFQTKTKLQNHYYKKHFEKEPCYKCGICKKLYTRRCDLKKHLISHSELKEFECPTCGSKFKRFQDLKKHKVDHESETFICKICSAVIKHKRSFQRHMSNHSEAKRYSCPKCHKYFHRKDVLAVHQKTCIITAE